jgi:hypothetical protein
MLLLIVRSLVVNNIVLRGEHKPRQISTAKGKGHVLFVPGAGWSLVFHRWWRVLFVQKGPSATKDTIWIGTFSFRSANRVFEELINEARDASFAQDQDSTIVFLRNGTGSW